MPVTGGAAAAGPAAAPPEPVKVPRSSKGSSEGAVLHRWFDERVLPAFADRVLPFDLPAARVLATYRVPEHARFVDALIAAVAQATEMTVATHNPKHFEPFGIRCFNPWEPNA